MKVTAYVRANCIWCSGVCSMLDKYGIAYERCDIGTDAEALSKVIRKTGQNLFPCVEIDGDMLADTSAQEVEDYLISHELVETRPSADTPANGKTRTHIAGVRLEDPTRFF